MRANVSMQNVIKLETALDQPPVPLARSSSPHDRLIFNRLVCERAMFQYHGPERREGFRIGPVDLVVPAGEILFIVGGNGGGKTTLLKLITGLYPAQAGRVVLDDRTITADNRATYRQHFSSVFSHFHLFDRLYGLQDVEPDLVEHWLERLQLQDVTGVVDGRFTNLDLSAGQCKRLALMVAVLENRPILVLDEVAADLDPSFRRVFYHEIIPDFRRDGRTVIAVSHDDAYFSAADRVLRMEFGQLVPHVV
jgi:putative ATP-binding cassette transporter